MHWREKDSTFRLTNSDVGLDWSAEWEFDDVLGGTRNNLINIFLSELVFSARSAEEDNRPIRTLGNRLFFHTTG